VKMSAVAGVAQAPTIMAPPIADSVSSRDALFLFKGQWRNVIMKFTPRSGLGRDRG
jgi:hypothetical protein